MDNNKPIDDIKHNADVNNNKRLAQLDRLIEQDNNANRRKKFFLDDFKVWLSAVWVLIAPVIFIHRNYGVIDLIKAVLNKIGFSMDLSSEIAIALGMVKGTGVSLIAVDGDPFMGRATFAIPEELIWHSIIYTVVSLAILWGIGFIIYIIWSWFRILLKKRNIQGSKYISIISNLANRPVGITVIILLFAFCLSIFCLDKYMTFNRYEIVSSGNIAYKIDRQSDTITALIGNKQISVEWKTDK